MCWASSSGCGKHHSAPPSSSCCARSFPPPPLTPCCLLQLTEALVADPEVRPPAKALIAERAAAADKRLVDGADEELQLLDVLLAANRAARGLVSTADRERQLIC